MAILFQRVSIKNVITQGVKMPSPINSPRETQKPSLSNQLDLSKLEGVSIDKVFLDTEAPPKPDTSPAKPVTKPITPEKKPVLPSIPRTLPAKPSRRTDDCPLTDPNKPFRTCSR